MKVVLAGATGFIGAAVLQRLIVESAVTSIVTLSRRELPTIHSKVQNVIVKDFHNYDQDTKDQLSDAAACIWCLGKPKDGADVHYDMTFAATKVFEEFLPKLTKGQQFRFVYTSGSAVVRDQSASTWFLPETRKMRGRCETGVVELQTRHPDKWQSFIVRPALVTTGDPIWGPLTFGNHVPKEELAATMVDLAMNGGSSQTIDMAELRSKGKALLAQS